MCQVYRLQKTSYTFKGDEYGHFRAYAMYFVAITDREMYLVVARRTPFIDVADKTEVIEIKSLEWINHREEATALDLTLTEVSDELREKVTNAICIYENMLKARRDKADTYICR